MTTSKRAMKAAVDMEVHAACSTTTKGKAEALEAHFPAYDKLLSLARDYRGAIEFYIRKDVKDGDLEGANMKRLTLQYVEGILATTGTA